jgi:hypothetical protein
MRTFMRVRHRAHWGAWASRRDLGFCGRVTFAPLGIQALKPFLVCSELHPDQRHRNPYHPQSLVGRSGRTSYSLVETWSVNFANCGERAGCASDARWRRIAPARKELRNGSNKSEREPTSGHSTNYGSAHLVPASPDIGRTFSWLPSLAIS